MHWSSPALRPPSSLLAAPSNAALNFAHPEDQRSASSVPRLRQQRNLHVGGTHCPRPRRSTHRAPRATGTSTRAFPPRSSALRHLISQLSSGVKPLCAMPLHRHSATPRRSRSSESLASLRFSWQNCTQFPVLNATVHTAGVERDKEFRLQCASVGSASRCERDAPLEASSPMWYSCSGRRVPFLLFLYVVLCLYLCDCPTFGSIHSQCLSHLLLLGPTRRQALRRDRKSVV